MKNRKITAFTLALCLLQAGMPLAELSASAVSEEELTFDVLNYVIENGEITISGCDATAKTVKIPSEIDGIPVTKIGKSSFAECSLTSVTIPEGVTELGAGSFRDSKQLAEVALPSTLVKIDNNAFNNCTVLTDISFPESLHTVGNNVFGNTAWLTAQKEKTPFVTVNHILIDASEVVSNQIEEIKAEKERKEQEALEAKIWKRAGIITNQVGYFPNLAKKATMLSESTSGIEFELLDKNQKVVYKGTSQPFGLDKDSGDMVHILDFSDFKKEGVYTLKSKTGETSREFKIGILKEYSGLTYDALNYFYQNRSGIDIEEDYITSGDASELARPAGHAPDIAEIQNIWGYESSSGTQDVTGGWYDAGDHGKYVVNGGISLWLLQNQYERAVLNNTAEAYQDGAMKIPENSDNLPDLLNETRYEMEWMLKMVVQDGDCQGMAYHKVHDAKWTALATAPALDKQDRILLPPSTAATLNLAACAAQAYRLWKDLDPDFAETCLNTAKQAYEAAVAHPDMYAPSQEYGGGGAYQDDNVTDEFYWAECELYLSTGEEAYYTALKKSKEAFRIFSNMNGEENDGLTGSFDWGRTSALGTLSLLLHQELLTEKEQASLKENLTRTADEYLQMTANQGYGLPYQSAEGSYPWGSNSFISDIGIVLAYTYDMTGNIDYLNGAVSAVDYLLGRNSLDCSYVTGYGVHSSQYPHHRWWAKAINAKFPKAPCGVLTGGANSGREDPIVRAEWGTEELPPQKQYLDNIEAYSVNECAVNWNSSLAWIVSYLCEQNGGLITGQASCGVQISEPEISEETAPEYSITVPEDVTVIGEQIFGKYSSYVTEVILPDSVKEIEKQAFSNCTHLKSIVLPETLELVGEKAFSGTPWLKEMLADSPMLVINGLLLDGTATEGDVTIPETVTSILGNAFYANQKITSVTIPEGVKIIGDGAFSGCSALTSVTFPESLETIQEKSFENSGLTQLTIPDGVKTIGNGAFLNCKSLPEVTIHTADVKIGEEAFGCTSAFMATGQYSYVFVHDILKDFTVFCNENSTASSYAQKTGIQSSYFGDANGDNVIDILDVISVNRAVLGKETLSSVQQKNADVNQNGVPDSSDSLTILKYIVNLVNQF